MRHVSRVWTLLGIVTCLCLDASSPAPAAATRHSSVHSLSFVAVWDNKWREPLSREHSFSPTAVLPHYNTLSQTYPGFIPRQPAEMGFSFLSWHTHHSRVLQYALSEQARDILLRTHTSVSSIFMEILPISILVVL